MHRSLSVAAALLLLLQGALHLQQYVAGFGGVPVIGPLFLAHAALAVVIAAALVIRGGRVPAAAGIALSVGAILALVLAKSVGLFGFMAGPWSPTEIGTLVVEILTVLALAPVAEPSLPSDA